MSEPVPGPLVDEWIYVATDADNDGRIALVAGLSIMRRPGRFAPIAALNAAAVNHALPGALPPAATP